MGTPQFALPSLEAILAAGEEVAAVVTQPDRPRGRGQRLTASPVKELALAWNVPVLQPQDLKDPELIKRLKALAPEMIIVVAYGRILPREVLALPSVGALNVHASLLPRYRGAAPINWALIRGEKETGVTIQWLRYEVDSGPIFLQERAPIAVEDNFGTLYDRLAERGAALLLQSLEMLRRGPASFPGDAPSPLGTFGRGSGRLDPGPGPQAGGLYSMARPGAQVIRRPGQKTGR
jgi:methionyl-tRNA formyltransferase